VNDEQEEDLPDPVGPREGGFGANLHARWTILNSSPLFRFAVRAGIPIAIVIAVALIVGSH
jgi:hypothetical protein